MGRAIGNIDSFSKVKNHPGKILLVFAVAFSITFLAIPSQNAEAFVSCPFDATSTTFVGGVGVGGNLWSNATNWSNGLPTGSNNVCIGNDISGTVSVLDIDFTLSTNYMIEIANNASLTIPTGITLTLDSFSGFSNMGILINSGKLINSGSFQNNADGKFDNFGIFTNGFVVTNTQLATINNYNLTINFPDPNVSLNATINNQGTFANICEDGMIENNDDPTATPNSGLYSNIINNLDGLFIGTNFVGLNPVINEVQFNPFKVASSIEDCAEIEVVTNNGNGSPLLGPTMGLNPLTHLQVVKGGFGIDGELIDVKNWYTPYGWNRDPGTHTFTMRILSDLGTQAITDVQLFTSEIGSWNANNPIWKITLERSHGAPNWKITVKDDQNLIGDVTFTTLVVEEKYLLVSITINGMEPTPDNFAIGVRMIDDIFGMNTNWFNDGIFIEDTYAYPDTAKVFEEKLNLSKVCTEDQNPDYRNSCAFEQKKIEEISKAQEAFVKITENKVISKFSPIPSEPEKDKVSQENSDNQTNDLEISQIINNESTSFTEKVNKLYLNFDLLQKSSENYYLNFDALKQ